MRFHSLDPVVTQATRGVSEQTEGVATRPGIGLWLRYAFGGRLPERYDEWVLHDLTGPDWRLREAGRIMLFALIPVFGLLLLPGPMAFAQSYGVGRTATPEEIRAWDIAISPTGQELPPGHGTAKEGAPVFAQKCAACHGATGSGGRAPTLIRRQGAPPDAAPTNAAAANAAPAR